MTNLSVEMAPGGGRRVRIDHPYLRGEIEVDGNGTVVSAELDTGVSERRGTLAARAGAAIAAHAPGVHASYVKASAVVADALGVTDQTIMPALARCEVAGPDGGRCEHLEQADGEPWCGACGCAHRAKQAFGQLTECPEGRWKGDRS